MQIDFSKRPYVNIYNWLCFNFSPDRYRDGDKDQVQRACNVLLQKSNDVPLTVEFLNRLWGMHGELPEEIYNIDSYGRLTSIAPNYAKPDVRERVKKQVDAMEPSQYQLERWGRG